MKTSQNGSFALRFAAPLLVLAVLLVLPLFSGSYLIQVVLFGLITAYLCGTWNISGGYGGLVSFAHGAFAGIGAYATAIPLVNYGLPGWLGMLLGGAISALAAFVLSCTICRFHIKGFYFCVSTILFSEILISIVVRSRYLGRGMGIPLPSVENAFNLQFLGIVPYYYMALALVCVMVLITGHIERSRLGWYLRATRQSEDASAALGIDVTKVKVVAMTASAFLAGIGGGVYVLALRYVNPYDLLGNLFSTTLMLGTTPRRPRDDIRADHRDCGPHRDQGGLDVWCRGARRNEQLCGRAGRLGGHPLSRR